MNNEFKKSKHGNETRYTLESASSGATGAGAVASVSSPLGGVHRRSLIAQEGDSITVPVKQKPRQGPLKQQTGAGAHRDKKKEQKQGKEKHRKPYMEDLKSRLDILKSKVNENSDLAAQLMATARSLGMNPRQAGTPEQERERTQQMLAQRAKERDAASAQAASDDARNLPQLKAEYEEMKKKYEALGGSNWQYADREQNLSSAEREARSMEPALRNLASKIARAEKAQGEVDEAAPFLAKAAGGIIGGAIGVLGAPGIVAILGPLLGIPFAAYGAYTTSKVGMRGVEKLWDMAAKKLGGDDEVSQYVDSNINKLPPEQAKAAADVAKKLSETRAKTAEDHSTMTQGYGRESGSTGQAFAGRMKGAIPEDAYFQKLESILEEKQRLDPKCWKGYKKSGTKMKGGVRVNNCVPAEGMAEDNKKPHPKTWHDVDAKLGKQVDKMRQAEKVKKGLAHPDTLKKKDVEEDWQKVNKQDKTDGMSRKAVKAYRRENPGSKLKTAVTTKPSKLKKGGKAAKRRSSFCARMSGMKKAHASAKTKRDPDSPINKALRRWNCHEDAYMNSLSVQVAEKLNPQADVDVWVQDFQKADPNKYHQFKNKTPEKKARMAQAAHYAANEPSKK